MRRYEGDPVTRGPAWLGIGAQRCGTTWMTGLLTQHPGVGLGTNQKKEQQLLHQVADGQARLEDYVAVFPGDDGVLRGEWTPHYMRHPSVPAAVARWVPEIPIFVLLRDPVERYQSAMRLRAGRPGRWPHVAAVTAQTWTGCYADQLDYWAAAVGRDRMHVMVYESVRTDPQAAVDVLWRRLGLDPVPLSGSDEPSRSSSREDWEWLPGLRETLAHLYRPQAERLTRDWGLDVSSWRSLTM